MKINYCKISNTKYVQIYLTEEELKQEETNEIIKKHKQEKCCLAIFVTGKENYPEILNKIIVKQLELSNNVC